MTSRIRQIGDPILRDVSMPIAASDIGGDEIQALVDHMQSVLNGIKAISDENGNALSAPQVGHTVRLILLRIDGQFRPMINPEFTPISEKKFDFEEECFSLYDKRATILRYHQIRVTYLDRNGRTQVDDFSGEESGLVQHEIDHLNGVLFVDHVDDKDLFNIDTVLANKPSRLSKTKEMMAYMVAEV